MPIKDLHISTQRILDFAKHCIDENKFGVTSFKSFCDLIDYPSTNYSNLKKGKVNLTPTHLERCAIQFGLNMNWIFGLSDKMYLNEKRISPIKQLKDAVKVIEEHIKNTAVN